MIYKVTKQYGAGAEAIAESFKTLEDAKKYMDKSAAQDATMKIKVTYRVYEFDDLLHEVDSSKLETSRSGGEGESSAGGKQGEAAFRPNPLATGAKPKGAIQHWRDEEEDKDKK